MTETEGQGHGEGQGEGQEQRDRGTGTATEGKRHGQGQGIQLLHLLLPHGKSNQADALNRLPSQEPVLLARHVRHDVLKARHEAVVVGHEMFLNCVCHRSCRSHNLFQNQLLAFLK